MDNNIVFTKDMTLVSLEAHSPVQVASSHSLSYSNVTMECPDHSVVKCIIDRRLRIMGPNDLWGAGTTVNATRELNSKIK